MSDYIPTTEVIKDACTFPRERLGEPRNMKPEDFDRWLEQVKEEAWDQGFAHSVRTNFHSRMPRLEDNPYRKEQGSES